MSVDKTGANAPPLLDGTAAEGRNSYVSREMVLNASVYAVKESDYSLFSDDLIERLKVGARVVPGLSFWKTAGNIFDSVVDVSAGVGSEMALARLYMKLTKAWDTDPTLEPLVRDISLLHPLEVAYPPGKFDIAVVDPWWGDRYDRESKTLDLSDRHWLIGLLGRPLRHKPKIVVMKIPAKINCDWLQRAFSVHYENSNTGYLVMSTSDSYLDVVPLVDAFSSNGGIVSVLSQETRELMGCSFVLNNPGKERMKGIKVLESDDEIFVDSQDVDSYLDVFDTDIEKAFELLSRDVVSTSSAPFVDLVINWLRTNLTKENFNWALVQLKKFFQDTVRDEVVEEFPDHVLPLDFSENPVVYKISGESEGKAFFSNGSLVTGYHVTRGKPMVFKGVKIKAKGFDVDKDLVWYGGHFGSFSKVKLNDSVYVATENKLLRGVVASTRPLQFRFPGAPVAGLSGAPIFGEGQLVVGIYCNHVPGSGEYMTLSSKSTWVGHVDDKLSELGKINVYVPCGQGKSTYLVSHLASTGKRVLVVMPRAALPADVARHVGSKARGFAGEEKIDDGGCQMLYLTHGKFLNAIARNPNRFDAYDVILIDEAHDKTALTAACIEWVSDVWQKQAALMTGSPHGVSFGLSASSQSKFKVKTTKWKEKHPLSVVELGSKLSSKPFMTGAHLVQVPSVSFAKKVISSSNLSKKSVILSRSEINKRGYDDIKAEIEAKGNVFVFATPVVNIGFTIPVDSIVIQGQVAEKDAPVGEVTALSFRVLTLSELYQWLGRVGRIREGQRFIPDLSWSLPCMTTDEAMRLELWRIVLGLRSQHTVANRDCTQAQARTCLSLPVAASQALGMVDEDGVVIVDNDEQLKKCEAMELPARVGCVDTKYYDVGKGKTVKGPVTGLDVLAPEFNELETVTTSFASVFTFGSLLFALTKLLIPSAMIIEDSYPVQDQTRMRKPNFGGKTRIEPGIGIKKMDEKVDDSALFFDTISTSLLTDCFDFLYPGWMTMKYKNCVIRGNYQQRKLAQTLAYYVGSKCDEANISLVPGEGIETDVADIEDGCPSPELLEKVDELVDGSSIHASVVLTSFAGIFLGVPGLLLLFLGSWLVYGKVPAKAKGIQDLARKVSSYDVKLFRASPVSKVIKTSIGVCSCGVSPYHGIAMLVSSIGSKVDIPLSLGPIEVPVTISTSLPRWVESCFSGVLALFAGSFVPSPDLNELRRIVNPLFKSVDFITFSGDAYGFLSLAGLIKPASVLGITFASVYHLVVVTILSLVMWTGPKMKYWTLTYPLVNALLFVFGSFTDKFLCEAALFGIFVFFLRLKIDDLSTMLWKGDYETGLTRDPYFRIINSKLYRLRERMSVGGLQVDEKDNVTEDGNLFDRVVRMENTVNTDYEPIPNIIDFKKLLCVSLTLFFCYSVNNFPILKYFHLVFAFLMCYTEVSEVRLALCILSALMSLPSKFSFWGCLCCAMLASEARGIELDADTMLTSALTSALFQKDLPGGIVSLFLVVSKSSWNLLVPCSIAYLLTGKASLLFCALASSFDEADAGREVPVNLLNCLSRGFAHASHVLVSTVRGVSRIFRHLFHGSSDNNDRVPNLDFDDRVETDLSSGEVMFEGMHVSWKVPDNSEALHATNISNADHSLVADVNSPGFSTSGDTYEADIDGGSDPLQTSALDVMWARMDKLVGLLVAGCSWMITCSWPDNTPYNLWYALFMILGLILSLLILLVLEKMGLPFVTPTQSALPRQPPAGNTVATSSSSLMDFRLRAAPTKPRWMARRHVRRIMRASTWSRFASAARKTKWLRIFSLSGLFSLSAWFIHPLIVLLSLVNLLGLVMSLVVFSSKFPGSTDPTFTKDIRKLLSHTMFSREPMHHTTSSLNVKPLPKPATDLCLVIGVAGDVKWLERAIGLYDEGKNLFPDLSCLLICDKRLGEIASNLCVDGLSTYEVSISHPSEMRSARMLPMFIGDKDVYYLHRDADWKFSPIEREAVKLRRNLTVNPLGMSPSPILMASVNYYGSAHVDLFDEWKLTRPYWKTYGHDERIACKMKMDHVYNRVTPCEEVLFSASCVSQEIPTCSMIVPRVMLKNSEDHTSVTEWKCAEISSYGTFAWQKTLHTLSSGSKTYCGSGSPNIISTSLDLLSFSALVALIYSVTISTWMEPTFFSMGKKKFFEEEAVSTSFRAASYVCGAIIGIVLTTPLAAKQIQHAKQLLTEDKHFNDEYAGINASRAARGVSKLLALNPFPVASSLIIDIFSFVSSPASFLVSKLVIKVAPFLSGVDVTCFFSMLLFRSRIAFIPAFMFLLASFGVPGARESGILGANYALVVSTGISYWTHVPHFQMSHRIELPYMHKSDGEVKKCVGPGAPFRTFVTGYRGPSLYVDLPSGMLNTRTATSVYLSMKSFVHYPDFADALVVGSGIGGLAQGMLHEGFKGKLTLVTLPEKGFTTSEVIMKMHPSVITHLEDVRNYSGSHDLVVCDVSLPPNDEIWWKDDFDWEQETFEEEVDVLMHAFAKLQKGGTLILSHGHFMDGTLLALITFLSVHFKSVDIVEEPIKNDIGHQWIVCSHKHNRRDPGLMSLTPFNCKYRDDAMYDEILLLMQAMCKSWLYLEPNAGWNHSFTPELHSHFRATEQLVPLRVNLANSVVDADLTNECLAFIKDSPLTYVNSFTKDIEEIEFVAVRPRGSFGAFTVHGRSKVPPVPDREFNAGVDLITACVLRQASLLPLNRMYAVPSQTNFMVNEGLTKRYAFPSVKVPVTRLDEVIKAFSVIMKPRFLEHSFEAPSWNLLRESLTRQSSVGYMCKIPAKNVIDLVDNYRAKLDDTYATMLSGGSLNLTFHASPKVEKKEIDDLSVDAVPRLFLYREGCVRLCSVRLSKPLNDLMADRSFWPTAACGTIFDRAETIVSLYERYDDPAACTFEASKWDGHVEAELYVRMRMFLCSMLDGCAGSVPLKNYLHSMTFHDVYGSLYMCDGSLVEFHRGNKKSGEPDTSYGNKIKNDFIALDLISQALGISPLSGMSRVSQITEGDDKEVIGERVDVLKIAELRNSVYDEYGIPQKGEAIVITCPEQSTFCSHGYTRLSNGIAVPIRDLHEVFGRLLVPTSNGAFTLDFAMASRCLTSVISLVATFWYLPEVRRFYSVIRDVIPKDVIPAAVNRQERWKFYYNLGVLNPTKFQLERYLISAFGFVPFDGKTNSKADEILNLNDFRSLRYLQSPYVIKELRDTLHQQDEVIDVSVWYEPEMPVYSVIRDVDGLVSKGLSVQLFTAKSSVIREVYLQGMSTVSASGFGSFMSILGRIKARTLNLMFTGSESSQLSWASNYLTFHKARNSGFRGQRIVLSRLNDEEYSIVRVIKTSSNHLVGVFVLLLLLSSLTIMPDLVERTSAYTLRGVTIESPSSTVVSNGYPVRAALKSVSDDTLANQTLGDSRILAFLNLRTKKPKLSVSKSAAMKTLSLLTKTSRRFGVLLYDDEGLLSSYLVYNSGPDSRLMKSVISKRSDELASLLGIEKSALLPVKEWKANGAMITVTEWHGIYQYGQLERPMPFFESLQGKLFNCVLFIRISDCPMLRFDGHDSNEYLFKNVRVPRLHSYGLVIGESSSRDHVDLPKPYDADLLSDSLIFGEVPWGQKEDVALFRGGSTGAGSTPTTNVRWLLIESEPDIERLSGYKCDFKFTSRRARVAVTLDGEINLPPKHPVYPKMSYEEMSSCKVILCPEGNEAPDRILSVMRGGSLVILLNPTHCVGIEGWIDPFLIHMSTVVRCEATVIDIAKALSWVKENDVEASRIAVNGQKLANKTALQSFKSSFFINMINILAASEKGYVSQIDHVVSWNVVPRGNHSLMFIDRKHQFAHGSLLNLDSSLMTVSRMRYASIGSGVSLFKCSPRNALNFQKSSRYLPMGESRSSMQLLNGKEISFLRSVGNGMGKELARSMGSLGDGNDFVELVGWRDELYLLVHSNSRLFSDVVFRGKEDKAPLSVETAVELVELGNRVAKINRTVIARSFGCHELVHDFSHSEVVRPSECEEFGIPSSYWWTSGVVKAQGQSILLGSPGNGAAYLETSNALVPHGTGGKGSRFRPLKGISDDRMMYCLASIGHRPISASVPTGADENDNLVAGNDSVPAWFNLIGATF